MDTDDFTTLLHRARTGDQQAMEQIAHEYEAEVRLVARVRLGSALRPYLDSVNLVQSVHRSLLLGLRTDKYDISTPENLIGLAVTMVRRKIARKWRRLKRQQRLNSGVREHESLPDIVLSIGTTGNHESETEIKDKLEQLFDKLDETEQRLIELRLEGYTTAEVARQLKLDPNVLRVRLSRLRKRLTSIGLFTDWI